MAKHVGLRRLLEVAMWKKCTPLWREAHSEVKMLKTPHARTTFGRPDVVQMSRKCTLLRREARLQVKRVKNWWFSANLEVSDVVFC